MKSELRFDNLNAWRGEAHILEGVTFEVPAGSITALLGRNGVGKTTTILAAMGLTRAEGSVTVGETELLGTPTYQIAQLGIAYVPEDRDVFSALTVAENLKLAERPNVDHRYDLIYELFPDLSGRQQQLAGSLSGGQQQMVAIARALLNPNDLLLVDEPTKGLAPIVIDDVVTALHRAAEFATILLVEQNLSVAARLAEHAVVLDHGVVSHTGSMAELAADAELTGRLLGVNVA